MLHTILLVLAIVCFVLDGFKLVPKINGTALGLAFYVASIINF